MKSFVFLFLIFCFAVNVKADVLPLLGSEFSEEHPGILPYSQCEITSTNPPSFRNAGKEISSFSAGFLAHFESSHDLVFLHCLSEEHNLGFNIPLAIKRGAGGGLSLGIYYGETQITIIPESLNNKTMGDLLNKNFSGIQVGCGIPLAYNGKCMGWACGRPEGNGIQLCTLTERVGLGIDISMTRFSFTESKEISSLERLTAADPYTVFNLDSIRDWTFVKDSLQAPAREEMAQQEL